MRKELIALFILAYSVSAVGQNLKEKRTRFFTLAEIGYGVGVGKIKFENVNGSERNESKYFRLRTQFGYNVSNKFTAGIGLGLDGYHEYTFNTAPLFVDVRYYLTDRPQAFFVFGNVGYSVPLSENFEKGIMSGISVGRKISRRRLILLPSVGFNVQQLQSIATLKSIQFNFGLMF